MNKKVHGILIWGSILLYNFLTAAVYYSNSSLLDNINLDLISIIIFILFIISICLTYVYYRRYPRSLVPSISFAVLFFTGLPMLILIFINIIVRY